MYNKIENEFIQESYFKKTEKIMILTYTIPILFCLVSSIFICDSVVFFVLFFLILSILCAFLLYLCLFINLKNFKTKKNKTFFKIFYNIKKYKEFIYEEDVLILSMILEKNHIEPSKLNEMINHYRFLIPTNLKKANDIIPYVSLIVSLVALFSTDFFIKNTINIVNAVAIIGISLLMYFCIYSVKSFMNLILGKDDLYIKLEKALSEIYIQNILK